MLLLQGDVHQALIVLQKGVQQCFPDDQPLTDPKRIQIKGNAMLLVGRYMEETANFESNAIMKTYKVFQSITFMDKCNRNQINQSMFLFHAGCHPSFARMGGWELLPCQIL